MALPRLVLLHGVGLDHTMWEPAAALLAGSFEVTALELPGHGGRAPARDGITLAEMADDVATQLAPGTHLAGFSLGALVAQHIAVHRPELVASLSSVSSVCQRSDSEREAVLARLAAAEADFPASVAGSLQRWFPDGAAPELAAATAATLHANNVRSYLNCYRVFATADAEIAPELGRITMPALALTGELDPGSTPEMTRRLAAAIPNCAAVVVPGARHMLPAEQPREFAAALTTFIEGTCHDE
ncbi:alpha/beta hydrolase [Arthrobacter sp. ERGS1:01]|uniref:alpha/beta fold hydrolase n=1 Tax=Arthrobacter sp. ERGS1:01 TaxID=1704044 RepID=UPI0006B4E715|nr:alpha/beta hydrolase [Arthrobacter sp. ERGS1:01]ALE07238.1 alpha/beta hydrolase [Arthrobacter sp. ERGS1:01]